jgi:hypothetical protein
MYYIIFYVRTVKLQYKQNTLKLQKEDSKYTNIAIQNKAKLTTCVRL